VPDRLGLGYTGGMDSANDTPHHDNAHSLSTGAAIGLTLFTVIGSLVCVYVGLIIGEYATL
jgi:hypothetical protein